MVVIELSPCNVHVPCYLNVIVRNKKLQVHTPVVFENNILLHPSYIIISQDSRKAPEEPHKGILATAASKSDPLSLNVSMQTHVTRGINKKS